MAEAVASHTEFRPAWVAGYGSTSEELREQVADFEILLEKMLEKLERTERERDAANNECERLRTELERINNGG